MIQELEHAGTPFLTVLLLTVILGFALNPLARGLGWVDQPDWRKQHSGDIPLAGGPAIVLAVFAVMTLQGVWSPVMQVLGWSSAIVFLTGLVDDRRNILVPLRFALQIAALLAMVAYGNVVLQNFGFLFWNRMLELGFLAVPITVFSAMGVINAYNMIDGMDGLSGSVALIALGGLAYLAARAGYFDAFIVLLTVFGSVAGFLLLNFRFPWRQRALVFLGDSGSSWIGFVLAWFCIALSQVDPGTGSPRAFAPIVAIWLFGIPLMDTTYVMIRRFRMGEPVFGSDRRHLHHLFLRSGFSVRQTWGAMTCAALLMAMTGILGELRGWPEWGMFYAYAGLSFVFLFWMNHAWRNRRFLGRKVE
jgi:UDP-GlcNAc:undecaprenyl-phosphate GlcNAc-1-phosphate transferase